jgi:hypothetical protein
VGCGSANFVGADVDRIDGSTEGARDGVLATVGAVNNDYGVNIIMGEKTDRV